MKHLFLLALLISCTSLFGQKVKKKIVKYKKHHYISYSYLKTKEKPKVGAYLRYKQYYTNGYKRPLVKGQYNLGLKVDTWTYYTNRSKEFYNQKGEIQWRLYYDKNDVLKTIYHSQNDSTVELIRGRRITKINAFSSKEYYIHDGLNWEGVLDRNARNGVWIFQIDTSFKSYVNYLNGRINGHSFTLYTNGDTLSKFLHRNGKLLWRVTFYKGGDTMTHSIFHDSFSLLRKFFVGNTLHQNCTTKNGKLFLLRTWDKKGHPVKESMVANGQGQAICYDISKNSMKELKRCSISNGCINGQISYPKPRRYRIYYENCMLLDSSKKVLDSNYNFSVGYFMAYPQFMHNGGFSRGENKLAYEVVSNFEMPKTATELGVSGIILARFAVEQDGNIDSVSIESKPLGYGLENEVKRVIKSTSGKWLPTFYFGIPTKSYFRFPFEIDNTEF
jgi:hypothetical protein